MGDRSRLARSRARPAGRVGPESWKPRPCASRLPAHRPPVRSAGSPTGARRSPPTLPPGRSRLGLVGGVGLAIAGEGERIALGDHPPLDVLAPDEAGGEDAVVNVLTLAFAGDRLRADEAGEGPCRDRAARVGQTAVVGARLIALGRVDPNKPEVSGADHDRVAVDHRGVSMRSAGWC